MLILEIDIGNSRAKWRLRDLCGLTQSSIPKECIAVNFFADPVISVDSLMQSFVAMPWDFVGKIWVSNVRGQQFEMLLTEKLKVFSTALVAFPTAVQHCAGVTNGYDEPFRLGVDRWLAILAAYNLAGQKCCVVDCGTTITLDLVSSSGLHLGGYILPGVAMMKDALRVRSTVLKSGIQAGISLAPGSNTAAAINNGVISMITGFIKQVLADEVPAMKDAKLFFTGGDGLMIKEALDWPASYEKTLVLDGLQFACGGYESSWGGL